MPNRDGTGPGKQKCMRTGFLPTRANCFEQKNIKISPIKTKLTYNILIEITFKVIKYSFVALPMMLGYRKKSRLIETNEQNKTVEPKLINSQNDIKYIE